MTALTPAPRTAGPCAAHLVPSTLAPGIVLFALFLAVPIGYTLVTCVPEQRSRASGSARARAPRSSPASRTTPRRSPTPSSSRASAGCSSTALILVPVMLGLALLFALLLDAERAPARSFSRVCDLPAVRGAGGHRLAAVGLPLPAGRQPVLLDLRPARLGMSRSLLAPGLVMFAIANIAVWGGVGFNMIVIYTALQGHPARDLRGGDARRGIRGADRLADQGADDRARR